MKMFISERQKPLNASRAESSEEPGSRGAGWPDYDIANFKRRISRSRQELSTCCERDPVPWRRRRRPDRSGNVEKRSSRSDFRSTGIHRRPTPRSPRERERSERSDDPNGRRARHSHPPGDNDGSIRRPRAPRAESSSLPRKRRAGEEKKRRNEKEEEARTHVIRSDLAHAAHAGGTAIRDRISRHRLRVVLVGNGNLGGLSTNTYTWRLWYSRGTPPTKDPFWSAALSLSFSLPLFIALPPASQTRTRRRRGFADVRDNQRAIITGDSAGRPRRDTSVDCHYKWRVRGVT